MATLSESRALLTGKDIPAALSALYPQDPQEAKGRYLAALEAFAARFGEDHPELYFFSSPGRTELGGNHTDHNGGSVLCGAVHLDVIAVVAPAADQSVTILSQGYPEFSLSLADTAQKEEELGTSAALCRGVAAYLQEQGLPLKGFIAYTETRIPQGSGVSSSAAFELLLGRILTTLAGKEEYDAVELAKAGKRAENEYYGKPSGLMDQMACALGGTVVINFANESEPEYWQVENQFDTAGHVLCLVKLDQDHADLTDAYAALPGRMRKVANAFGKERLCEVDYAEFKKALPSLREKLGDLPLIAALHFYQESERAKHLGEALRRNHFPAYLDFVNASGASSFQYLQNVLIPGSPLRQSAALALNLANEILCGASGACRIHGGGFGGTTQNYVPLYLYPRFVEEMEAVFGKDCVLPLVIRNVGATQVKLG